MKIKIGLETHIQLNSKSKIFCGCENPVNLPGDIPPNSLTCEICTGMPGSKPRANKAVIEMATKVALALNCSIAKETFFSRKTYFYPDMSKNFQITQYEIPLASNGEISVGEKKIRITRIHMEEDPAKLIHVGGMGVKYVLVDYNRSGIPLIEVVTEPDFESPQQARIYIQKLAMIMEYLGVYNALSEASIKTDANISIDGGERVEIKNITGTKEIEKALNYEVIRQRNVLRRGNKIVQETRAWNPQLNITTALREKETEADYGYIFEPDLTKIEITKQQISRIDKTLPELPDEKEERFIKQYKISQKAAESLVSDINLANLFEEVSKKINTKIAASWIAGPLMKTLNWNNLRYSDSGLKKEWIIELLKTFEKGEHTDLVTEQILRKMIEEKKSPKSIAKELGLKKIDSKEEIKEIIKKVLDENKKAIDDYKSGERKALEFLVGQCMKLSKGAIDAKTAREIILKTIK